MIIIIDIIVIIIVVVGTIISIFTTETIIVIFTTIKHVIASALPIAYPSLHPHIQCPHELLLRECKRTCRLDMYLLPLQHVYQLPLLLKRYNQLHLLLLKLLILLEKLVLVRFGQYFGFHFRRFHILQQLFRASNFF